MADDAGRTMALNDVDTALFIDKWQSKPCLWMARHTDYKNKAARNAAMVSIANHFQRGWTVADITSKMKSLKAYYRTQKRKKAAATTTGSAGGKKSKAWEHFATMDAFMSDALYNPACVTSSLPSTVQVARDGEGEEVPSTSEQQTSLLIQLPHQEAGSVVQLGYVLADEAGDHLTAMPGAGPTKIAAVAPGVH